MDPAKYDVFISYRRKGGAEKAQLVKSEIKLRGIEEERIFLDTHSLHDGDFEQKIKVALGNSKSVVVIISNGCFDQIKETDFWYMEIKEALSQSIIIVPIFFDGMTSFASLNIPKELENLSKMNAVTYQHEYADAAFDKLLAFINLKKDEAHNSTRRGCLFSFNYKGCLVSVALVGLFVFILTPIVKNEEICYATSSDEDSTTEQQMKKRDSSDYDFYIKKEQELIAMERARMNKDDCDKPCASPNMDNTQSERLLGTWHTTDNTYEYHFAYKDVRMEKLNEEGKKEIIEYGIYHIKGNMILFVWKTKKQQAKFYLQDNKLTLSFSNNQTVILFKK